VAEGGWRDEQFLGRLRETGVPGSGFERSERVQRWQGSAHLMR
jgi:hypothetical protein